METLNKLRFDNLAGGAGKQTLLKTSIRSLVDLIAISDKKANILLSVNTIIISIVITLGGVQLVNNLSSFDEIAFVALPALIFLLSSLTSGLLAIYAVNPKKVHKHDINKLGIFLLAVRYRDVDAYLDQMSVILKSNELIYENITTDLHTLGEILVYKNTLLRKAYIVFFVGISLSVFSFISIVIFNLLSLLST